MLHRFPTGVAGEKVHQKRLPARRARRGCETVRVHFPRYGRHADELCVTELASVIWAVQMSTVEFHPWNSRRADTETARRVAHRPRPDAAVRLRHGAAGRRTSRTRCSTSSARSAGRRPPAATACTSTSGSRRGWGFADVRRAALAFAREVERRAPDDVTTTWWRKDRDPAMLFVDYNQNARDHTIASAYSVRGVPRGDRLDADRAGTRSTTSSRDDFTIATVPARFAELGDLHAGIDDGAYSLETLLEWADRDGWTRPGLAGSRPVRRRRPRGRGAAGPGPIPVAVAAVLAELAGGLGGRVERRRRRRRRRPRSAGRRRRPARRPAAFGARGR